MYSDLNQLQQSATKIIMCNKDNNVDTLLVMSSREVNIRKSNLVMTHNNREYKNNT